ncbi:MAG: outer membrane beta-barrel protein [Bacteroidota bacterium]
MRFFYCSILLLLAISNYSFSQNIEQCVLEDYRQLYNQGQLNDIPASLEQCLETPKASFPIKEERIEARKLLTLVYIYLDDTKNASRAMVRLLKEDPEHEPSDTDPAEFIYLYNKFSSDPIFTIGIRPGLNFSNANQLESFSVGNESLSQDQYTVETGVRFGVSVDYKFKPYLEFGIEAAYSRKSFTFENENIGLTTLEVPSTDDPDQNLTVAELTYIENQDYLDAALYVKYNYLNKNWKFPIIPYAYLGAEYNLLLDSELDEISLSGVLNNEIPAISIQESVQKRETTNLSIVAGIGAKYKVLRIHYIGIEARYALGLTNVVNQDARFLDSNPELINEFLTVDDNFKVNNFTIGIGFYYSIFRTKDLTQDKRSNK